MDIAPDTVADIVIRLRAIEVKEGATDPDSGSNPIDDGSTDVLVSGTDDATEAEVRGMIGSLDDDAKAELLALFYIGRGDMEPEEWDAAVKFAREREAAGDGVVKELLGSPDAGDLLEEGLDALALPPTCPRPDGGTGWRHAPAGLRARRCGFSPGRSVVPRGTADGVRGGSWSSPIGATARRKRFSSSGGFFGNRRGFRGRTPSPGGRNGGMCDAASPGAPWPGRQSM